MERLTLLLVLSMTIVMLSSCDLLGLGEDQSRPEGPVIVASVDGNETGLWLFDPETLERTNVVESISHVPRGVAFSPNYESWYLTWRVGSILDGDVQSVLAVLDPRSGRIVDRAVTSDLAVGGSFLTYDAANRQIVAYGGGGGKAQFFDAETLELVHEQPIGLSNSYVRTAVVAEGRGKVYFGANAGSENDLIHVYDTDRQEVIGTLRLIEDAVRRGSTAPIDLALSPDERYLFATTFTSLGLDGFGAFFMIDLETGEVVAEHRAGKHANLAVSPDGRYVYIDCPAGGLYEFAPTNQVLRFDTQAHEMDVFLDGPEALGLEGRVLIADQITMLPNGNVVFENAGPSKIKDTENNGPTLIKVDANTGEVLAMYIPTRDERGYVTAAARQLEFGIVPK